MSQDAETLHKMRVTMMYIPCCTEASHIERPKENNDTILPYVNTNNMIIRSTENSHCQPFLAQSNHTCCRKRVNTKRGFLKTNGSCSGNRVVYSCTNDMMLEPHKYEFGDEMAYR
jgi:hypothetical protein